MVKQILISTILLIGLQLSGQSITPEVKATAGNSFTSLGYTLDWTLGELSVQTHTNDFGVEVYTISEGFHQPNYNFISSDRSKELANITEINAQVRVYPNPAKNNLFIELDKDVPCSIEITSVTGNCAYKSNLEGRKSSVGISGLQSGVYVVRIYNQEEIIDIIKITKL